MPQFTPTDKYNYAFFNNNYIGYDNKNGFTHTLKTERFGHNWFFGKIIHWLFYSNESVSHVRDIFQKAIAHCKDTCNDIEQIKNVYQNATHFNARVIETHNSRLWRMFRSTVSPLDTDMLKSKFTNRLDSVKRQADRMGYNPKYFVVQYKDLSNYKKTVDDLRYIPEIKKEIIETDDELIKAQNRFALYVETTIDKISNAEKLTNSDFDNIKNLIALQNEIEMGDASKITFYPKLKKLTDHFVEQREKYLALLAEVKKLTPDLNKIRTATVKEILSDRFVLEDEKKQIKTAFLRLWQQKYVNQEKEESEWIISQLEIVAKSDHKLPLNRIEDVKFVGFAQFLEDKTLSAEEKIEVVAAKSNFEKQLDHIQTVVEAAQKAFKIQQKALKDPHSISQALAELDTLIHDYSNKPFHQELKSLVAKYKPSLEHLQKIELILDDMRAEIKAHDDNHDKLVCILRTFIDTTAAEERAKIDETYRQTYSTLRSQLEYVRSLTARCVAIQSGLKGRYVETLNDIDFSHLEVTPPKFELVPCVDPEKVAPALFKKHNDWMVQIANRQRCKTLYDEWEQKIVDILKFNLAEIQKFHSAIYKLNKETLNNDVLYVRKLLDATKLQLLDQNKVEQFLLELPLGMSRSNVVSSKDECLTKGQKIQAFLNQIHEANELFISNQDTAKLDALVANYGEKFLFNTFRYLVNKFKEVLNAKAVANSLHRATIHPMLASYHGQPPN